MQSGCADQLATFARPAAFCDQDTALLRVDLHRHFPMVAEWLAIFQEEWHHGLFAAGLANTIGRNCNGRSLVQVTPQGGLLHGGYLPGMRLQLRPGLLQTDW